MSFFTTRVLLHKADENDYESLHKSMEDKGFSRTITSDDNRKFHLPQAEYDLTATLTCTQVRALASEAAASTGKKFSVLVSQSISRCWEGLDPVK